MNAPNWLFLLLYWALFFGSVIITGQAARYFRRHPSRGRGIVLAYFLTGALFIAYRIQIRHRQQGDWFGPSSWIFAGLLALYVTTMLAMIVAARMRWILRELPDPAA